MVVWSLQNQNLTSCENVFAVYKNKNVFLTGTIINCKSDGVSLYKGVKFESPKKEVNQLTLGLMLVKG